MLIRYIYNNLMRLKFNKHIGAGSNCRKYFLWLLKINAFTLNEKKSSLSSGKNQPLPPTRKPNGLSLL